MGRLTELEGSSFDLIIIGGGIIGTGIARDAALRGLKVVIFEKGDFGGGTTSGSTRLIHGGLRYLEMLDFRLVRLDLKERETLLRIAPHLVQPLEFLVPFYGRSLLHRWKMKAGMVLYDLLSFDKSLPRHRFLSRSETMALEPQLRQAGLQGAAAYHDAQANSPERLCVENILDAHEHGASIFNYVEVTAALHTGDAVSGVRVKSVLDESASEVEIKGRVVVNASGPWFDRVAGRLSATAGSKRIRTTKGVHLACSPINKRALVLFSPIDDRLFFAIPWLGYSWISTTDTDFTDDPVDVRANARDVDYLVSSTQAFLPAIDRKDVVFSNSGVRALVMEEGSESSVSRMHRIEDGSRSGTPGLVSILGGKLTGYRAVAEEVTDIACRSLSLRLECQTARIALPGARGPITKAAAKSGIDDETVQHLNRLYGTRHDEVVALALSNEQLKTRLGAGYPDIAAQVIFAIRTERCVRVSDFIWRRSLLGFSSDQGIGTWETVADLMSKELSWSPERRAIDLEDCRRFRDRTQEFRRD